MILKDINGKLRFKIQMISKGQVKLKPRITLPFLHIICSNSTIETLGKCAKCVQS